jgi:hypothetical protein
MKTIYTGSYKNCHSDNCISISGDHGQKIGYIGPSLPILAPKKDFWMHWHNNIGVIPESENTYFYVKSYYEQVLSKIDPDFLLGLLDDQSTLLCYEDNLDFCHRHLVAFWLELTTNIKTYEISSIGNYITILPRPNYLKDILIKVIEEYNIEHKSNKKLHLK